MITQHTPGPWRWELVPGKEALTLAVQVLHDTPAPAPAEFCKLVVVTPSYHPINALLETAKADARLIAAAPELLAALEALAVLPNKHRPEEMWEAARAAIAKARGQ
jgi:type VI protein secretion system component VasF